MQRGSAMLQVSRRGRSFAWRLSVLVVAAGLGGLLLPSAISAAQAAGFDGDGRPDVLARDSTGRLWFYRGDGSGGWSGPGQHVGSGWQDFDAIVSPGDWGGDGKADVLAREPDGKLWLYHGTGAGGFSYANQIGSGWNVYDLLVAPGDWSGDGKPDLLARRPDGTLWLYRGNGAGGFSGAEQQIGSGWQVYDSLVVPGDWSGDGKPDLLARRDDGTLWLYRGNGAGGFFGAEQQIGTGWQVYNVLLTSIYATDAPVAPAQPFYGFNAVQGYCPASDWNNPTNPTACNTDRMDPSKYALGQSRPSAYRMRVQYNVIEANRSAGWANPWKEFDQQLAWATARNVKVLLIPTLTTAGSTSSQTWDFPDSASELSRWRTFIKELVQRYGADARVLGAELWNEPNGSTVYTGGVTVTPAKYAALACSAINGRQDAVALGATRLTLMIGALAYNTSGVSGSFTPSPAGHMGQWINQVGAAMPTSGCPAGFFGTAKDFDGVSIHLYPSPQVTWLPAGTTAPNPCVPGSPTASADIVNGCRQAEQFDTQLRGFRTNQTIAGGSSKPIHVTEFGWHRVTVGSQLGTPTSQQYAYRYTFAKCKAAQTIGTNPGVRGCYAYPLTSVAGFAPTDLESEGLWGTWPSMTPSAAAPEYLNALLDQQNNPTQYP